MDPIHAFNGINNVADPLRLGLDWLKAADNVIVTQTGAIRRRDGYELSLAATMPKAYSTLDFSRCYVIDGNDLKQVHADLSMTTLASGFSTAPMYWTEINDQVFFNNGVDAGVILKSGEVLDWAWTAPAMPELVAASGSLPAGTYHVTCTFVLPDGRETGSGDAAEIYLDGSQSIQIDNIPQVSGLATQVYIAPADSTVFQLAYQNYTRTSASWNSDPNELGVDLTTFGLDPFPAQCSYIAAWRGRIYAAQFIQSSDFTVVWFSEPLGFHLFSLNSGFITVPGKVVLFASHDAGLVIGTDTRIFVSDGETLKQVADYGAVPGWSIAVDDDKNKTIYFWSKRGLCRALPFENLTQQHLSVAPGIQAGGAILHQNGEKHYVVALHSGGAAFNQRSTS